MRDITSRNRPRPIQTFQLRTSKLVGLVPPAEPGRSKATGAPTFCRHALSRRCGSSCWRMRLKPGGAANPLPRHLQRVIHFADASYRAHEIFRQPARVAAIDAPGPRDFPASTQLDLGGIQIRIDAEQLPDLSPGSLATWRRVYFPTCRGRSEPASPQPINRSSMA